MPTRPRRYDWRETPRPHRLSFAALADRPSHRMLAQTSVMVNRDLDRDTGPAMVPASSVIGAKTRPALPTGTEVPAQALD